MSDVIIPRWGEGYVEIFVRIGDAERVFKLDAAAVLDWAQFFVNKLEIRKKE